LILVDTSVWVDHLRSGNKVLMGMLDAGMVLVHPFVIGELALGHLRQRTVVLAALSNLPQVNVATDREVLHFIEHNALSGRGIGYVDVHLLAAVRLTAGAMLWTIDRRLSVVAAQLDLAVPVSKAPARR
jgi:predicted nucleic acid-binding protein